MASFKLVRLSHANTPSFKVDKRKFTHTHTALKLVRQEAETVSQAKIKKMSVTMRNAVGAIFELSSFKFPVLCGPLNQQCGSHRPIKYYEMKPEFFDDEFINHLTASQAQRILKESETVSTPGHSQSRQENEKETSAQRKRRKKKPPVLSDEEEKVSTLIERVLSELIMQVKDYNIFVEPSKDFLLSHENNKASRMTALTLGCGDLFQELCAQGVEETFDTREKKTTMLLEILVCKNYLPSSLIHNLVENADEFGKQIAVGQQSFFIPAGSRFLMSSFSELVSDLYGLLSVSGGYDLIVMDPPWYNKSVKRKKTYDSFDESELCSLPVQSLCKHGGLICVWVTNNKRILSYLKDVVFPTWSVKWMADWFWTKVTKCGEPICDIRSPHKKPYERLVIGRLEATDDRVVNRRHDVQSLHPGARHDVHNTSEIEVSVDDSEPAQTVMESHIPEDYVLVSVPCSLHSKKPPLSEVMSPYIPSQPRCLELFARNLMPGWTSWGNEVLRHQHIDYYEAVS